MYVYDCLVLFLKFLMEKENARCFTCYHKRIFAFIYFFSFFHPSKISLVTILDDMHFIEASYVLQNVGL